jgi:hypothetical protein
VGPWCGPARARLGVAAGALTGVRCRRLHAAVVAGQSRRVRPVPERGDACTPVILALLAWGDRWMAQEHGRSLTLVHEPWGGPVTPQLHCPNCGGRIEPADTRHVLVAEVH